jgi:hypothetical protein
MRNFTDEKIFLNHGARCAQESFTSAIFAVARCEASLDPARKHDIEFSLSVPLTAPTGRRRMSIDDIRPAIEVCPDIVA